MFKSRGRKILRDIWSRKSRTVLVSIAIFIGVVGVVALLSSGDLLIRQLKDDLKQDELAMIRAFVGVPKGTELDNDAYLEILRDIPAVTVVQGNANYPISWKLPGDAEFSDGFVRSFSEPFEEVPMEPMRLIQGRYPTPNSQEVAIERRMADKYGLQVGDELDLRILGAADEAVSQQTWTIVGIVFHSYTYFGGSEGFLPNETSVYAVYEDAQRIAGFTGFSSIYARYTDYPTAEREAANFLATIRENSPYMVMFNYMEAPEDNIFIRMSVQYTGVFSALAMVALVVSGFLVTNVISQIVLEQQRQIGVMKSLGATRGDNFMIYAGIALIYGLIGVVPGVLLGVPLGYKLAQVFTGMMPSGTIIEEFTVSYMGVGVGVAAGLLVPVLAAIIPVYNGTKVTILQAMTDLGISSGYGSGRTARLIGALPIPINARQALSNVVQKKSRLALTVATLAIAVAAFMGVLAVVSSLNQAISGVFDAFGYEIQALPTDIQGFEAVHDLIVDNVEGVSAVYPSVSLALQVEGYADPFLGGDQLQVIGIDPSTDSFRLDLKEGTAWQNDPEREGIVLSFGVADQLGKKAGDTLSVAIGGETAVLDIIGIDRFPFDTAFMEWRALARLGKLGVDVPQPNQYFTLVQADGYAGTLPEGQAVAVGFDEQVGGFMAFESGANFSAAEPGVIVSVDMAANGGYQVGDTLTLSVGNNTQAYPIVGVFQLPPQAAAEGEPTDVVGMFWEALAALEGRALEGEPATNALLIKLENREATSGQVDEIIKATTKVLVDHGISATYTNQVQVAETNAEDMMSLALVFNMTSFVMAAVGAIGLLSTLTMSVFERQKEIGVMRSIGAGSGTVAGQFLVEGILVGLIAWIIGAPLSYLLGMGLMEVLPFGFVEFIYPPVSLVIGLVGMLVIATIASLWPSISAARKTVAEIIRYQ